MSVDVGTVITDYSWSNECRPIITITEDQLAATVQVGEGHDVHPIIFEMKASSKEFLADQMQGWCEIFGKAAEILSR
jgi:hypothetical protein